MLTLNLIKNVEPFKICTTGYLQQKRAGPKQILA